MSQEFPPLATIPPLTLHESIKRNELDASKPVHAWLASLSKTLNEGKSADFSVLFLEKDSWWRDFVALTWDIECRNGADAIHEFLRHSKAGLTGVAVGETPALQPQLVDMGGLLFIQSGFTFKTDFGTGRGVLRLANVGFNEWKAWTVFTSLERLHGQTEVDMSVVGTQGVDAISHGASGGSMANANDHLQVLVIGAGHSGLALAAHLKHLGLRYLVVEQESQPGSAWRARYKTLKSHTPKYSDHYPFLQYPSDWPTWLGREHIINWMDHYSKALGLNIEYGAHAQKVKYDEAGKQYSVELGGSEGSRTVRCKHLVLATGLVSKVPNCPEFFGQNTFQGQTYHSSSHKSAGEIPDVKDKKITILGCGTSAHDIALDFVNHGAKSVTMIQRHPIYVLSLDSLEKFQVPLWNTPGMMAANDMEILKGLEKAGMAVKRGDKGDSLLDHQLVKLGRLYIDQGASRMIIDGRIKVIQCEHGVREFYSNGVILGNGTSIASDVVVFATGFQHSKRTIEAIMGKDVSNRVGNMGALDDVQEVVGWWRPTEMPGFWYMTGNFLLARQLAPVLALQINAIECGLNTDYYKEG
ncbi:hypothetical protein UA08_01104 [Talaromyces atroroseus]|uniref:FAD/NAD(P)-binding domain-containing protein n=1 Tax=Talaromyces atroroseus TaxID=1441469 RepID=A0A225AS12_TALAT|nr:hypothetical protein UA08_01104 [Talaromyces atroroseus]OKL64381.1 hypothetical protein UA08_01104 [Talaromyces atroroseus]